MGFICRAVAVVSSAKAPLMVSEKNANRREDVHFRILGVVEQNPRASQREIAARLGVSLGGVNYCLNALVQKGHVKVENFKASTNKLGYFYVLTPEGVADRARLAARFVKRKMAEYEAIKAEIEGLRREFNDTIFSASDEHASI
jgi:EPS-associated MarR family transcriptional regulator